MTQPNLMDYIPIHQVEWKKINENQIILFSPKSKYKWIRSLIKRINIDPFYKVHLDEYGSCLWQLIDGKQTVYELCNHLKEKYGSQVEPVYERGCILIKTMAANEFIKYNS